MRKKKEKMTCAEALGVVHDYENDKCLEKISLILSK